MAPAYETCWTHRQSGLLHEAAAVATRGEFCAYALRFSDVPVSIQQSLLDKGCLADAEQLTRQFMLWRKRSRHSA